MKENEFVEKCQNAINLLLDKASDEYADNHPGIYRENDGSIFDDFDKPKNDFIAGALWLKEQII